CSSAYQFSHFRWSRRAAPPPRRRPQPLPRSRCARPSRSNRREAECRPKRCAAPPPS
ncbi:MAG: hypothetical protein AVDCRST_MAG44-894, partial [uncultured Sphingomonas sp.]